MQLVITGPNLKFLNVTERNLSCCFYFQGALASTNPILRCAAGEALGRMSQVVGESKFVAEMAQYSFDRYTTHKF